ncbi:helix-turn-helix domain-containing protein [Halogeometricum sp. S1BR25-6]|uniref:Helix-turn-helix domain-containing protein n=1 Tax=Halogeometricum salsisoli TaxID=2950536 RepID=A0ABU2GJU4_9EURY|nr:helix-turn-helix domain-containing protein [Halogeometricum sp. S1BR25-6]MDS0300459.1 helix-turn-helix domain-containing protein [Halogeometricum sp. S1BR25-6]
MIRGDTTTASWNAMFDSLAHATRRRVLAELTDSADVSVDSLSRRTDPDASPETTRTTLYHAHLPKLERNGFIWWDRENDTVGRGPRWETAESVLTAADYLTGRPTSRP